MQSSEKQKMATFAIESQPGLKSTLLMTTPNPFDRIFPLERAARVAIVFEQRGITYAERQRLAPRKRSVRLASATAIG